MVDLILVFRGIPRAGINKGFVSRTNQDPPLVIILQMASGEIAGRWSVGVLLKAKFSFVLICTGALQGNLVRWKQR